MKAFDFRWFILMAIGVAAATGGCAMSVEAGHTDAMLEQDDAGPDDDVDACRPICANQGTRSEGWFDSCSGELIGFAGCDGCDAECLYDGTRAEGWYDSCGEGLDGFALIDWADCE